MPPSIIDCEDAITSVTELGTTYDESATTPPPLAPRDANINNSKGHAHENLSNMFNHSASNYEVQETANNWKEEGKTLTEHVANGKRVTSSAVFRANKVLIDSEIISILLDK